MSEGNKPQGGPPAGGHGPHGHGQRPGMMGGKPKETKKTIRRLLTYLGRDKGKVIVAVVCAICSSATMIAGSYLLSPIIDGLTQTVQVAIQQPANSEAIIQDGIRRLLSGLLLMAGHKRYIFPHTSCLIHDGSSGAIGSIGKMLDNLEFTKELEVRMKAYIISSTHITEDVYDKNYRRDWFMFSEEMIKLGIADEIVTDIDTIL